MRLVRLQAVLGNNIVVLHRSKRSGSETLLVQLGRPGLWSITGVPQPFWSFSTLLINRVLKMRI
jgi:hypothetical protein